MIAGVLSAIVRKRSSLSRITSSAWMRAVMSIATPPIRDGSPPGPGIGNLLTIEWWTPSPCSSVSIVSMPFPLASASASLARN